MLPLLFLQGAPLLARDDNVVPGTLRVDATFEHIGALWWVDGDDDLDSSLQMEFRHEGETLWVQAAPAMRAHSALLVNGAPLGLNFWASSAFFLEPGESYELRLTLIDPDGGSETRTAVATLRTLPPASFSGRHVFVIPGTGGGKGSPTNPFKGLQSAAHSAEAGDIFHVSPGTYERHLASGNPLAPIVAPIVFMGPGSGLAVVDGRATDRGIITLGDWNQTISHIVIEGLTLEDARWGIDGQHSREILIRHNLIRDVDYGVLNRRGHALEGNQTICDNLIEGRVSWPGVGIPSERGIDLRGYGNVVCHNRVRNFGDCISLQPSMGPSYGNDVFGNDAALCVDDGIEIDYNQSNVRVWRNRVMNARMGISVQPIRGGPAYIFRNELFNLESVPVKMHNDTSGFFVVHNTGAKHGDGHGDNGAMWRNAVFRNNLFLGTRYAFEFTTVADEGYRDLDYNGWGTTRAIGSPTDPYFKWDNVRYGRLPDLQSIGVELHGVEAAFGDVVDARLPVTWDTPAIPGSRDLRLSPGAPEIDVGEEVENLNDAFGLQGVPDLGAFEFGQPLPSYGPRPWPALLFADGFEAGSTSSWSTSIP